MKRGKGEERGNLNLLELTLHTASFKPHHNIIFKMVMILVWQTEDKGLEKVKGGVQDPAANASSATDHCEDLPSQLEPLWPAEGGRGDLSPLPEHSSGPLNWQTSLHLWDLPYTRNLSSGEKKITVWWGHDQPKRNNHSYGLKGVPREAASPDHSPTPTQPPTRVVMPHSEIPTDGSSTKHSTGTSKMEEQRQKKAAELRSTLPSMQQEDIKKNQYNILKGRKEEPWNKMSMVSKRNIQGQQWQPLQFKKTEHTNSKLNGRTLTWGCMKSPRNNKHTEKWKVSLQKLRASTKDQETERSILTPATILEGTAWPPTTNNYSVQRSTVLKLKKPSSNPNYGVIT